MRLALLIPLCAIALSLAACGGEPADETGAREEETGTAGPVSEAGDAEPADAAAAPEAEPVSGAAVYAANCAACHGDRGEGDGPAAVGLEPPPADMTDDQWTTGDGSLSAIRNTIENGSPGTAMIAWQGTLTEAEIDAVARYVQSLGRRGGAGAP